MHAADPPHVAILLSVYDGDRFIDEQLESIAAQRDVRWTLTWRDDSSDPTRSCDARLEAFRARFPTQVFASGLPQGRMGVGASYMALLAQAPDADYVAFADQDDVWLPDKLSRAVGRLAAVGGAALYCGRQSLVDATLAPLGLSQVPRRPLGFANALVQNVATGCTMVLNRAAHDAIRAMPAPDGALHDWWAYLVVAGIGGHLIYDAQPFILYRQHERNAVGSTGGTVARAIRAMRRGPGPFLESLDRHLRQLLAYRDRLTPENRRTLDALWAARVAPLRRRPGAVMGTGVYRQGTGEDLVLRAWLMLRSAR